MGKWTADQIPDLGGRTALVTGANSGLGLVTARELARKGATVVMACRDAGRGGGAIDAVRKEIPGADVRLESLDLADLSSVSALAERLPEERLDLLFNNAGIMAPPRTETADGFELQFGTNHLGHFALTGLLLGRLLAAPAPRVVCVTSGAHRIGSIDFDDLQSEKHYWRWTAYGQSKLANLLFARELARRSESAGARLRSTAAHPGYSATHLQTSGPTLGGSLLNPLRKASFGVFNKVAAQSDEMGALPQLYAAFEDIPGGSLVGPDRFDQMAGHPKLVGSSGASKDTETARRLWDVSRELTGVGFDELS
jgi:NAD(P)-dependent dehydrogenase (short-subunit alcohol dehydrogenase family)